MNNSQIIELHKLAKLVEKDYFTPNSKFILTPSLIINLQKFIRDTENIFNEELAITEDIKKVFLKDYEIDEEKTKIDKEYDKEVYQIYINSFLQKEEIKNIIKDFKEKEFESVYNKLKLEDIEASILSLEIKQIFKQLI